MSSIASSTVANSLASSTGLNSGMDINAVVTSLLAIDKQPIASMQEKQAGIKKQQAAYSSIQTKISDLLTSIKKLTKTNFDGTSIFNGMSTTTSNTGIASATAAAGATAQSVSLEVKSLPSSTRASSTGLVGKLSASATMSDLGITDGTFTMYVNNVAKTYTVSSTQTLGDVFSAINADNAGPPQITAGIVDGKVSFSYTGGSATSIQFGSGADNSNFLSKLYLNTAINNGTDTISGSQVKTTFSPSQVLSDASTALTTPVTDGTFTINGVSFDTTGKSLSAVMTEINSSSAKVTASYNSATNKFQLISKDTGSAFINMADGSGNFLTSMGLVSGGNSTSSQTVGKNAEFVLNGTTMYSTSTTVSDAVSGLTGVTLNLASASPGTTIQIGINADTSSITGAVQDVIAKYNAAITAIDSQTDSTSETALLKGDNRLKTLRNSLRTTFTQGISGVAGFGSLQDLGITTGAVGTGTATKGSPQLQFDSTKFLTAFASNPEGVRKMFIAKDYIGSMNGQFGDDNMQGGLTKIQNLISDQLYTDGNSGYGALYAGTTDNDKGLFASYQSLAAKRIKDLDNSITKAQERIDSKEKRLRAQYAAMDKLVGQYNTQGTALSGLINSLKN